MVRAVFNGAVIAESDATVVVEGNHYFPRESIVGGHLVDHERTTACPWKGTARYYTVQAGDQVAEAAAWYYPEPKEKAEQIRDHVAFYPAVSIEA